MELWRARRLTSESFRVKHRSRQLSNAWLRYARSMAEQDGDVWSEHLAILTPGAYSGLKSTTRPGGELPGREREQPLTEIEIAPGLRVFPAFGGRVPHSDSTGPYDLLFYCVYDAGSRRYEITELIVTTPAGGPPVSSAGLQEVAVREAIRQAAPLGSWRPVEQRPRPKRDDEYADAAREYVHARLFGFAPLEHVAKVYNVSQSTATRIVAEARRRGFATDG